MEEVSLRIGRNVFKVNKELLCKYSDYFRAMFNGCYLESDKEEININMLDPNIVRIIIKFMETDSINLHKYSLATIVDISMAANFLQIIELQQQIQDMLCLKLSESNCFEIERIAKDLCYTQLVQYSATYGLLSFKSMKLEYIPTIQKLIWYLSNPYLDSQNELHVFELGLKWLSKNRKLNAITHIVACLDMTKVTNETLLNIRELLENYVSQLSDNLVLEIIDCLLTLTDQDIEISELSLREHQTELLQKFSARVWSETLSVIKDSRPRLIKFVPVVPLWISKKQNLERLPQCLYTFENDKFEQYLEVADESLWGWNLTAWGLTRLVVVGGEYGRGTGVFMREIKVYDTLMKKWIHFGGHLPPRRHAGVVILGDLLFIIGGFGEQRVSLDTTVVYDLKQRTCRSGAKFPVAIISPGVCIHNNKLYAAGQQHIYSYETSKYKDYWKPILSTGVKMTHMQSFKNYMYCKTDAALYRFIPDEDQGLQIVNSSSNRPGLICNLGNHLKVFRRTEKDEVLIEDFVEDSEDVKAVTRVSTPMKNMWPYCFASACSMVMTMPPVCAHLTQYHRQYFMTDT